MSLQNYLFEEGKYEPINILPTGVICKNCHHFSSPQKIGAHLSEHVPPINSLKWDFYSKITRMNPSSISFSQLLKQQEQSQIGKGVKTFVPEDMPKREVQQKNLRSMRPENHEKFEDKIFHQIIPSNIDYGIRINGGQIRREMPVQRQGQLTIMKQIKLEKNEDKNSSKRQILIFKNGATSHKKLYHDQKHKQMKIPKIKSHAYLSTDQSYHITPDTRIPNKENFQYHFNFPKKKVNYHKDSSIEKPKKERKYQNACRCCGGFQCRMCGSTIPQIYGNINPVAQTVQDHGAKNSIRMQEENSRNESNQMSCFHGNSEYRLNTQESLSRKQIKQKIKRFRI